MNNINDPWDIRHLGEEYFKKIGYATANKYSLDVPIKLVLSARPEKLTIL
ncbi:MAG: hypothetical protein IPG09_03590 [Ignavibacteria bacterium]|nr:hypothetical protein [Ignavibacteria bacterium]